MYVIHKPFEPKKSEHRLTDRATVALSTERRATERGEYDNKIKVKNAKLEELKIQRDEKWKRDEMRRWQGFSRILSTRHCSFIIQILQ